MLIAFLNIQREPECFKGRVNTPNFKHKVINPSIYFDISQKKSNLVLSQINIYMSFKGNDFNYRY